MVTPLKTLMGFSVYLNVQLKFYNLPNLKERRINFISTAYRLNPVVRKLVKKSPYWRGWLIDADVMLTDYRLSNYEMTGNEGQFFKRLELVPIQETLDQIKDELKR